MILAAGLGLRMRPLTDSNPKALVAVDGRTLIDRVLDRLVTAGIARVVINLHYRGDMLRAHLQSRCDVEIIFSDESELLLDTGGGLKRARPLFGEAPLLAHNCDSLWQEGMRPALDVLMESFDPDRMDILMLLAPVTAASGYEGRGDFHMDTHGRLTRRHEVGVAPFVWTGVQIFNPRLLDGTPEGPFSANLLFDKALAAGRLYGLRLEGSWMHVGDPRGLAQAEAVLKSGFA
jgi:MurNAc alpha-1-phosphate uridylyltransferase